MDLNHIMIMVMTMMFILNRLKYILHSFITDTQLVELDTLVLLFGFFPFFACIFGIGATIGLEFIFVNASIQLLQFFDVVARIDINFGYSNLAPNGILYKKMDGICSFAI